MDTSMDSNNSTGPTDGRHEKFLEWLRKARGVELQATISAHEFRETGEGWGLIAETEIRKGTTLFSIPRPGPSANSPLLSVQTSRLMAVLTAQERARISRNWLPLLLVLLWERVQAILNPLDPLRWAPYFDTLPEEFDTLMFWNQDELAELTGSTILDKIGKEEVEKDYETVIKPMIESRADLFPVPEGTSWEENYGIAMYHRMGSLVLSRSFHVEASPSNEEDPDEGHDVSMESAHSLVPESVDNRHATELLQETPDHHSELGIEDEDEDDDEQREAVEDIAMLPLADLLNAKTGSENARLFYETDCLKMKATRNIKKGEQIYNTYGDPPNSDLLRRYGHVDDPNRFDVVEISIKTCVEVAQSHLCSQSAPIVSSEELQNRLDWALEMGIDDVFEVPTEVERKKNGSPLLPEELTCLLKILLLSGEEFEDHKSKEKLPKPKLNNPDVISLAQKVIDRRMKDYPTSIDEDERLLEGLRSTSRYSCAGDSLNRRIKAIIVRKSEKQILAQLRDSLAQKLGPYQQGQDQNGVHHLQKRKINCDTDLDLNQCQAAIKSRKTH
ncbi:hypothetical protein PGT21_024461 [Puccinia graminis f. sp. tritici]|uniref:SET domain-containing protein n=1 Tax=Puccinia graminis f. sp. tritici TaxID=56615 RepID=A0A5B0PYK2_PUCGR|nr:hypothetical protein PGT21_024461 [Puccinia graminis f. sp. tritici]KAA1120993.1 hypothetical protein PGTUg99_025160 [Puccinia graminis f. sp. tritici]